MHDKALRDGENVVEKEGIGYQATEERFFPAFVLENS